MTRQEKLISRDVEYFFKKKGVSGGSGVIRFSNGRAYFLPRHIVVYTNKNKTRLSCYYVSSRNRYFITEECFNRAFNIAIDHALKKDGELRLCNPTKEEDYIFNTEEIEELRRGFDSISELLAWVGGRSEFHKLFTTKQLDLLLRDMVEVW